MQNTNGNFWQNLAEFGRIIFAHVNISYDGAKRSLHIEIAPTEPRELVNGEAKPVEGKDDLNKLPNQSILSGKQEQIDQARKLIQKQANATNNI